MDGVISLPIAFGSFFFLPDSPDTTRAWYLTKGVSGKLFIHDIQIHLADL